MHNAMKPKDETHKRSIIKAVSWRAFGMLATTLIVFAFTKKVVLSLSVGLAEAAVKIILFYLHERAWEKVAWGRVRHPLSEIPLKTKLTQQDLTTIRNKLKELGYAD